MLEISLFDVLILKVFFGVRISLMVFFNLEL